MRNLHLITACGRSCLAAARVSSSSASGTAVLGLHRRPIHCRAPASQPSRGSQGRGRAARTADERFLPRTQKLSPLCISSLSVTAPGLPVLRGVSGGGAALSSLCRRFPGGDIMNLTSRRSPLSGLSFSLFFFLRERKRGYWRRRSHKISVAKSKKPPTPDGINNISFFKSFKGVRGDFFQKIPRRFLFIH